MCRRNAYSDKSNLADHSILCKCARCKNERQLGKESWDISQELLRAAQEGRPEAELETLRALLETLNAQRASA